MGHEHSPHWAFDFNVTQYCPQMHLLESSGRYVRGEDTAVNGYHDVTVCTTPYCISVRQLRSCHSAMLDAVNAEVIDWNQIHELLNQHYTDFCK